MNNYLIEIGVEELPADYIDNAILDLENGIINLLKEHNINYDKITNFSTPRRLTVLVENIDLIQPAEEIIQRGPSVKIAFDEDDNPNKPLEGFLRSQGADLKDVIIDDGYTYIKKIKPEVTLEEIITENMASVILGVKFPRTMKWGYLGLRFARPIRWILSTLNDKVIDFKLGDIKVSNVTKGHRVLGSDNIVISDPLKYEEIMKENYVIVDAKKRRDIIEIQSEKIATEASGILEEDESLYSELTNIVEYPTALLGEIKEEFLKLPAIVITTAIKEHLRFIPIYKEEETLLPFFISIANSTDEYKDVVIEGNEKVLGARLEDANFFFQDDLTLDLDELYEDLDGIMYQEQLGTVKDRVDRLVKIVEKIGEQLSIADAGMEDLIRATELSKIDLLTGVVREFPELQGTMGEIYAKNKGESNLVSTAIREQYLPTYSGGDLPQTTVGSILSMADKLDAICGMFAVGQIPTGSQDPFGLRRAAIGIINIIENNSWNIDIRESIKYVLYILVEENSLVFDYEEVSNDIYKFFLSRIKVVLRNSGIRYDIVDGLLNTNDGNIYNMFKHAEILNTWFEEDRSLVIESVKRVNNIVEKHGKSSEFDESLFNEHENKLLDSFNNIKDTIDSINSSQHFDKILNELIHLTEPIEEYFDNVLVFDEDESIKENRIKFLTYINNYILNIFDFSKIVD